MARHQQPRTTKTVLSLLLGSLLTLVQPSLWLIPFRSPKNTRKTELHVFWALAPILTSGKCSDLYFLSLDPLCMFLKPKFTRTTLPRTHFVINVPSLQNKFIPHLMIDSCLHCETFQKLFPDGITGNHYFFWGALMHSICLLMENTYCAELKVSSEQRKIGLCP